MQAKIGNSVIICGSLPRDAEYKTVGDKETPLCKFGVKVDERDTGDNQKQAVWCNCTCWRDVAKVTANLQKGDIVLAIGKLQTRTYTGREGDEKTATELVCEAVFIMPRAWENALNGIAGRAASMGVPVSSAQGDDFEEIVSDSDLPF